LFLTLRNVTEVIRSSDSQLGKPVNPVVRRCFQAQT
jgi:hypothetical protein